MVRAEQRSEPQKECARCNYRIQARPTDGSRTAKLCQICLRWHCIDCCDLRATFAFAQTSRQRVQELECCEVCHSFLGHLRWVQEEPPAGLQESSALLFALHCDISKGLTALTSAAAQLDGLARLAALQVSPDAQVPEECIQAIADSERAASKAQACVEEAVQAAEEIQCPPPPHRDAQLREALVCHAKRLLGSVKPRLNTARLRAGGGTVAVQAKSNNSHSVGRARDSGLNRSTSSVST